MNLDNLTQTSGEWLRGTGPESDIVISTRIRLARNLAAFPFTNRASRHQKAEIEAPAARPHRQARLRAAARLPRRRRPVAARPPVPRRAPAHQPRAGHRRRPARRRLRRRRKPSASWSTRRTTSASRSCAAASPSTRPGRRSTASTTCSRSSVTYAFSDEFGYLTACPTNVGTGMRASVMLHLPALVHHQADREGLPRPAEDQPRRPRPLRRRQPGLGRLLPDLQPGDARQERDDDPQRDPRASSRRSSTTSARPAQALTARAPAAPARPGRPGLRHALHRRR